jgi:large repetitive protein
MLDNNQDGIFTDPGDGPIPNVVLHLEGTDDLGQAVSLTTTTDATGAYSFTGLRAGTYMLWEEQPTLPNNPAQFYADGKDYVGSIQGTTDPTLWGQADVPDRDRFVGIQLGTNQHGVNYVFTELQSDNL